MKDPWCIVAGDSTLKGSTVKRLHGNRFSSEKTFRDIEDPNFGTGLKWQRIKHPGRRDRMMFLATLAMALLTMLGNAGDRAGGGSELKTSTKPGRQLSLFRRFFC